MAKVRENCPKCHKLVELTKKAEFYGDLYHLGKCPNCAISISQTIVDDKKECPKCKSTNTTYIHRISELDKFREVTKNIYCFDCKQWYDYVTQAWR